MREDAPEFVVRFPTASECSHVWLCDRLSVWGPAGGEAQTVISHLRDVCCLDPEFYFRFPGFFFVQSICIFILFFFTARWVRRGGINSTALEPFVLSAKTPIGDRGCARPCVPSSSWKRLYRISSHSGRPLSLTNRSLRPHLFRYFFLSFLPF